MFKRLCILAGCVLLTGCGLMGEKTPVPEPEQTALTPVMEFMIENEPGASASLTDDSFGGEVRITMEEGFLSAASEMCKRATLLSAQHEAEIIVICRPAYSTEANAWRLAPRVWGKGIN